MKLATVQQYPQHLEQTLRNNPLFIALKKGLVIKWKIQQCERLWQDTSSLQQELEKLFGEIKVLDKNDKSQSILILRGLFKESWNIISQILDMPRRKSEYEEEIWEKKYEDIANKRTILLRAIELYKRGTGVYDR